MKGSLQMTNQKFIVLLDIDGVLNFLGKTDDENFTVIKNDVWATWTIKDEVLDWLKKLSKNKAVEVLWLSTWQNDGNVINDALQIEHFLTTDEVVLSKKVSSKGIKLDQIWQLKQQCPIYKLIAIDDELEYSSADLHIQPDSEKGLTVEEMNTINRYINQ